MKHDLPNDKPIVIDQAILTSVLSKLNGENIIDADYQVKQLQGGTLGDVRLVSGLASDDCGQRQPYKVVWKTQKRWERPGDINSWRREYDLYRSDLGKFFTDSFHWPDCYHMKLSSKEIQIWMEYIDGVSGKELDIGMLEQASCELGRFQGRIYRQEDSLNNISCLGDPGFMEREFSQWHTQTFSHDFLISEKCRIPGFLKQMLVNQDIELYDGKSFEFSYLRSRGCDLADHLKQMLIDIDERKIGIFHRFSKLSVVLCHRDFWIENIFSTAGKIRLIDWDTAGWGYVGEDIASLIIDETKAEDLEQYCQRLIPAYQQGLSENMENIKINNASILEMILIKFGYRILQEYMFSESSAVKERQVDILQKLFALRKLTI